MFMCYQGTESILPEYIDTYVLVLFLCSHLDSFHWGDFERHKISEILFDSVVVAILSKHLHETILPISSHSQMQDAGLVR